MSFILKIKEKELYVSEAGKVCTDLIDTKPFNTRADAELYIDKKKIANVEIVDCSTTMYGYMSYYNESKGYGFIKSRGKHYYAHITKLVKNPDLEYPYQIYTEGGIDYKEYIVPRNSLVKFVIDDSSEESDTMKKSVISFKICKLQVEKGPYDKDNKEQQNCSYDTTSLKGEDTNTNCPTDSEDETATID